MKGKKNEKSTGAPISNSTVQREEREQLLRGNETEGYTGVEDDLDLQEEGHRVDGIKRHDKENNEDDSGSNRRQKHWLWDNWILTAIGALVSFAVCNLFIGEISDMGISAIEYFCSGSLVFSICYFVK
jgi:hypothetical protein